VHKPTYELSVYLISYTEAYDALLSKDGLLPFGHKPLGIAASVPDVVNLMRKCKAAFLWSVGNSAEYREHCIYQLGVAHGLGKPIFAASADASFVPQIGRASCRERV
jgi:hypothetical protein